ncbi:MAG: hypothetical protein GYA60_08105, partial [Candidatus Methanofastidiosa archaeon]|nr:hypothetical protein [Candidatus Methanofastidiosa archaeon]
KSKIVMFVLSFLFFVIASFTHAAPRFFIPVILLIISLFSFHQDNPFFKYKKVILAIFASITLIIGVSLMSPENRGRAAEDAWRGINEIENNRLQELYIEAGKSDIKLPPRLTWAMHNKYRISIFDFVERYADHFSFNYLFLKGEASLQRIPDMGVLLFVDIIFLPLGFCALFKNKNRFSSILIFSWLLLAPIPSAMATGEARMNRATLMIIPLTIISALGASYLTEIFKRKGKVVCYILVITAIFLSSLYSLNQIFIQKPLDKPWYKQAVNEKLTTKILNIKDNYKGVVVGNDDYIYFLFYGKISPSDFVKRAEILSPSESKWERVQRLDNIYFKMPFKCPKSGKEGYVYVCEGIEIPQNAKVIDYIYYPDGVPAYSFVEFYPISQMPVGNKPLKLPNYFNYMKDLETKYPEGVIPNSSSSLW